MSRVHESQPEALPRLLPLLGMPLPDRIVAWRNGEAVSAAQFMGHVHALAVSLPTAAAAVNLCDDRYAFLVAFCAIIVRGQTNLLPPSRAPQAVVEVMAAHPGCYALGEQALTPSPPGYYPLPALDSAASWPVDKPWPQLSSGQVVVIGYTSGSTGKPSANRKTWGSCHASTAGNVAMLHGLVGPRLEVVATVPPQHMYGLEMSVLLPLLSDTAVHAGRPFFPADVATALDAVPAPRVLVTTPVHLRALVESGLAFPPVAAMISATAPLSRELAQAAEQKFDAPMQEVFGSTETCVIASRRATLETEWALYDGVSLHPQPDGASVDAPQLSEPVSLADIVSLSEDGRRFCLQGRHADMLDIAGKRASLNDLTGRLLAIPGVSDGVMIQLSDGDALGVHRLAALVVAPYLDEHQILSALRMTMDPVFLPRPLRLVASLPRNETGKLPRAVLLDLLRSQTEAG